VPSTHPAHLSVIRWAPPRNFLSLSIFISVSAKFPSSLSYELFTTSHKFLCSNIRALHSVHPWCHGMRRQADPSSTNVTAQSGGNANCCNFNRTTHWTETSRAALEYEKLPNDHGELQPKVTETENVCTVDTVSPFRNIACPTPNVTIQN